MKAITMDIKRRPSTKRTIVTSVLGTAAASAASYAVREVARQRGSKHGGSSAMMPRSIERIFAGGGGRATPIDQRPMLFFDKGNVLRMLEISTPLRDDSPAAAVALMDFVAQQQGENQHYARSRLTTLLETSYAHPGAIRSNLAARTESQQSNEGYLTSQLSFCELTFLGFKHSVRPTSSIKLTRLAEDLENVATDLGKRNDQRRQASARIILADVYLELGQNKEANEQMSRSLVLIGTLYNDSELTRLSTEANGPGIITRTYQDSTDPAVKKLEQQARVLADSET